MPRDSEYKYDPIDKTKIHNNAYKRMTAKEIVNLKIKSTLQKKTKMNSKNC